MNQPQAKVNRSPSNPLKIVGQLYSANSVNSTVTIQVYEKQRGNKTGMAAAY
jgi:hypothetical protein